MLLKKIFIKLIIFSTPIMILLDRLSNFVWCNFFFGNNPKGAKNDYLNIAEQVKKKNYPEVENYEKKKNIAIDKHFLDYLALHTQITIKKSECCYAHGRLLYTALSDYLLKKPKELSKEKIIIIETGTARGFSAICMAKALDDNNKEGLILTFDLLPHSTRMFWNSITDHLNGSQTRAQLLNNWNNLCQNYILFHQGNTRLELPKIYTERVHFAFLDGAHTYNDLMFEFNQIKNKQKPGDIIVYDDYDYKKFPGIVKAIDEICIDNNYNKEVIRSSSERGYVISVKN